MSEPNEQQRRLIENLEGPYIVKAGPGTGKTFTITRRYANILDTTAAEPQDILLVTFTRNAASEMRDRIVDHSDYDSTSLQDAPINTFHAYCYRLLRRYGHYAPSHLGIDEQVPRSLELIEDAVQEGARFRTFISQFGDAHPEHEPILATVSRPEELRGVIHQLAAKGIIPTAEGWYRNTEALLQGGRESFIESFEAANTPVHGAKGTTQSLAREGISGRLEREMDAYPPSAPSYEEIIDYPQVNEGPVIAAFDEDREDLFQFVHDLYLEYFEFALGRNYLTHGLMLALAFVMLVEEDRVRRAVEHEYVMIDEFQDTNELQFKISLLLAETPNLCVVGDWKQSIYGFQYTAVENILEFESRLDQYRDELNRDSSRVPPGLVRDAVQTIPLRRNYRSTQSVIDFTEQSLTIPATQSEEVDAESIQSAITSLDSTTLLDNSKISAASHDDEIALVLDRIQEMHGNSEYAVQKHDEPTVPDDASIDAQREAEAARLAPPTYEDMAVFTRKHSFARELIDAAEDYGIPLAYEGGIELFDTDQAKLLLAWLRIIDHDGDKGWAVVLEKAGYTLPDAKERLETDNYPVGMRSFRDQLAEIETLGGVAQHVFDRYGYDGAVADTLISELTKLHEGTIYTRGEAIEFLEENLHAGTTADVDTSTGQDAVTLQTIHAAKGLEYPIVIMANLNQGAFPHYGGPSGSRIRYDDTVGVRQTKSQADVNGRKHVFDSWEYDVLSGALPNEYDEERRLLYVAMSRAKRHLWFTAGEKPSPFFSELEIEPKDIEPTVEAIALESTDTKPLVVDIPDPIGPIRTGVHDIMDETVFEAVTEGAGTDFGQAVHDFAEAYAEGQDVHPTGPGADEQQQLAEFIDTLRGELLPEQTVLCPLPGEPRIVLTGIIDLLHITPQQVDIIDYKTDRHRHGHQEYCKQLSVYYHVLKAEYPDRKIQPQVYYTADGKSVLVKPWSIQELREVADDFLY